MTTLAEYEDSEHEAELRWREQRVRDARGRFVRACTDCLERPADFPGRLCPGCLAYRDHL